jgi:dihydrofolate reductase
MRIVVINHVTLDGVMQGPGRTDEDTRDGFRHGGWAIAAEDPAITAAVGQRMSPPGGAMLLGRRSYEDMLRAWNQRGGSYKDALNAATKYVASHDPQTKLQWPNSTLLHGDVAASVAELKNDGGGNLVIMGSGELIRSLLPHELIDEFLVIVHPLVLGEGRRLFEHDGSGLELELTDSFPTEAGAIVATYEPR